MKALKHFLILFLILGASAIWAQPALQPPGPTNGSISNVLHPTFFWNNLGGATNFAIEVLDGPTLIHITPPLGAGLSYTPAVYGTNPPLYNNIGANLLNNHTYNINLWYFTGVWNVINYTFTTVLCTPYNLAPTGTVPVLGQSITWSFDPSITNVEFRVSYTVEGVPTVSAWFPAVGVSPFSYALPSPLLYDRTYSYTVDARVTAGPNAGETSTASSSFNTVAIPAPVLVQPYSTETGLSIEPYFDWTWSGSSPDAQYSLPVLYDLYIDGAPIITNIPNGTTFHQLLEQELMLTNNAVHTWYIKAHQTFNAVKKSTDSPTWNFKTAPAAAAILSSPGHGTTTYSYQPVFFGWYLMTGIGNLTFQVQYVKASALGIPANPPTAAEWANGGITTTRNVATLGDLFENGLSTLSSGTKYWWRVITYRTVVQPYNIISFATPKNFTTSGSSASAQALLTYPKDNIDVYTVTPRLYWYTIAGDLSNATFEVFIDGTSRGTTTNLYFDAPGAGPALGAGASHTWYVVTHVTANPDVNSSPNPATFNIVGGIAQGLPQASWPVGNPTIYINPPALWWFMQGSTLGLSNFEVRWNIDALPGNWAGYATGTSGFLPLTQFNYQIPAPLLNGRTYYWAVASWNGVGYSNYSTGSFTTAGVLANIIPVPAFPKDNIVIYSTGVTLSWYAQGSTAGITKYQVVYSKQSDFTGATTVTVSDILDQFLSLSGLTPGATYYWKVAAHNGTAYSAYSAPVQFQIATSALSIVPMVGNPVGVPISTTSPMFSWALPSASAPLTYELQYATKEDMSNAKTISGITSMSQIVSGLETNQVYYWRVRSAAVEGKYSSYSPIARFTIPGNGSTVTGVDDGAIVPTEFALDQNYPNPFNPTTKITYTLPQNSIVTIKIYNMLGQEVKTLISQEMNAGNHSINWNAEDNLGNKVSSGMYLYRISAGNFVATKKMVLMK